MLSQLPSEILYHIAAYIPTARCLINLAQTCRRLYDVISSDNYRVFQAFVQNQFASIDTPPLWRDAARALTSRSRAFDRKAIIGRFVIPPTHPRRIGLPASNRTDRPTMGYRPVIDSYETWYGDSWNQRKEVLVWGAGADIIMRISDIGYFAKDPHHEHTVTFSNCGARRRSYDESSNCVTWTVFNDLHGVDSYDDISGIHLLPSSQTQNYEEIIFGRRSGALSRVTLCPHKENGQLKKRYVTGSRSLEKTDISTGPHRVLAASLDRRSVSFYRVDAEGDEVHPFADLKTNIHSSVRHRCSRLLSDDRIAIGSDGPVDKLSVFDITPDGVKKTRDIGVEDPEMRLPKKPQVLVIEPLSWVNTHVTPGDFFLAGWNDSKIR